MKIVGSTMLVLIGFAASSCGAVKGISGDSSKKNDGPTNGAIAETNSQKEDIKNESWSITVSDTNDLPACDSGSQGRLAWIKATSQFMACDTNNWTQVTSSQGLAGKNSLVRVDDEAAGEKCPASGKAIKSGIDDNADNILQDGEIKGTSYVCNGSQGLTIKSIHRYLQPNLSAAAEICLSCSTLVKVGEIQLVQFSDGSAWLSMSAFQTIVDTANDVAGIPILDSFYIAPATGSKEILRKFDYHDNYFLHYKILLGSVPTFEVTVDEDGNPANDTLLALLLTEQ